MRPSLRTAEATRALDPDAEGAGLLGVLDGSLHGTAERHPTCELVGDTLGDERSVELGCLISWMFSWTFGLPEILVSPARRRSASAATATDDDARTGGVHVDAQAIAGALDLDAADGGVGKLGHQVVADLPVLDDVVGVVLLG